jgi:Methyltransferase domain
MQSLKENQKNGPAKLTSQKLPLIITVDVEALPNRQASAHVDRLIWGRFNQAEWGINQMMDIAQRYDKRLTFFLDYCEVFLYPGVFEQVSKAITGRSHDAQLHAHPELLPPRFWSERGMPPARQSLTSYSREHALGLMRFLAEFHERFAGCKAVAFRGGNFRFNQEVLTAMSECGLSLSFNYNVKSQHQRNNGVLLPMFRWNNGITEVPLSTVALRGFNRSFELSSAGSLSFADSGAVADFIDKYRFEFANSVLVMLLHSWSFLYRQEQTGFFEYRDSKLADSFERFLATLPEDIEVITASELARRLKDGSVKCEAVGDVARLGKETPVAGCTAPVREPQSAAAKPTPAPLFHMSKTCNYCGTPAEEMMDFGGRPKVRCPKCRSLERQRVFLWAYEAFIKYEFGLVGKRLLLVTPSDAILAYLKPIAQVTSCDVRPVEWFDRQLDVCRMPEVASGSFDAVVAKSVLQHVYDDAAALAEIHRVLRPWGRVFLHTGCRTNAETEPVEDPTMHYGKEALEKYKVGTFRRYGDRSLLRMLQRLFLVKTFYGFDPVTGVRDAIYCGIKDPQWHGSPAADSRNDLQMAGSKQP